MNCAIALNGALAASSHPNQEIPYVNSVSKVTVASTYSVFFTNPYSSVNVCGAITACSLHDSGCSSSYTAGNLIVTSSTGEIKAK